MSTLDLVSTTGEEMGVSVQTATVKVRFFGMIEKNERRESTIAKRAIF